MKTSPSKISLNLNGDAEVSVKGFIAPIEYTEHNAHIEWDALANLHAAEPEKQYPASIFQAFLPSESVLVGECWQIKEQGALELLRQLHPNPILDIGNSCGLWACLRAYNDEIADVVFRIHAKFDLAEGQFTPSQFAGNLIIDRTEEKITFFQMHVPDGTLNFNVIKREKETYKGKRRYSADIGFCPKMELSAGRQNVAQDAEFTESITQEEAEHTLILT